jgi:hypothetical protein
MDVWFKVTFPSGRVRWVHSNKGWAGLIPYVQTIPQRLWDGTTIRTATKFESLICRVKNYFYDESCIDLG